MADYIDAQKDRGNCSCAKHRGAFHNLSAQPIFPILYQIVTPIRPFLLLTCTKDPDVQYS